MIPAPVSATCLFVVIRLAARRQIRSAGTVARRGSGVYAVGGKMART
jgi:hypothetical protein